MISLSTRYGSVPTADTLYITAGAWAAENDTSSEASSYKLTPRLTVSKATGHVTIQPADAGKAEAALKRNGDWQPGDPWCQVLKSTDGGASWAVVYNDTTSGL
jgi:hypothetical protein